MGVAASSSSSSSSNKYDVFLSFRGEDTRRSFTSHLHRALYLKGVETFIDYELPKGDDISQSLIQAIENSSLSVIVFSENYASSKWCLNELLEILRCKEEKGQLVVPIFYQVNPSHVRKQEGPYEEAFAQHSKKNPKKVVAWRKALFKTANLAGWHSYNCRDEAELIQNIVNYVKKKLNHGSSSALANIVGIDENCDAIEFLLEGSSTVGIWGMGGIGKTTMAKVVFAKIRSQFDSCCFFNNFRKESEKHGPRYICDELVKELSKDRSLEGLGRRKVLIVLDDVSDTSQLEDLEKEAGHYLSASLRHGSKVIITSRDRHVLEGRVEKIHKAIALGHDNSLELFNLKAFRIDGYKSEYKKLVKRALAYARGVPLALIVLGSFLYSRTMIQWESALSKLERTIHPNIQDVLKVSYDGLDDEEKEVFLDIACFLRGESEEYVLAMLKSYGFHADICLSTLMDKALISIGHSVVRVHDLIQSMAFEIVRQEYLTNPERCRRLVNPDDIYVVLKNNQGSDAIQGISLDLSRIGDLQLSANTFKKMTNLRFLKFYSSWGTRSCTVNLPSGLDSFSKSLRYLQWDNFPSESLPLSSCAETIVQLHMPNSHLKKLWDGVQNLVNLREINLYGSKYLMELPNISTAQNLERLCLDSCESLSHIDPLILSLPRLLDVSLNSCIKLKSLKTEGQSKSISTIDVCHRSSLKEFSFSSDKIGYYKLQARNCTSLKTLQLTSHIESSVSYLRNLSTLILDECEQLYELHESIGSLFSLRSLDLKGSNIESLPASIKHLLNLAYINLSNCRRLRSLPELPFFIEEVDANGCISLELVPNLATAPHLTSLLLKDCLKLENHYMESACFPLKRAIYTSQVSEFCESDLRQACEFYYPGRKVPEWFKSSQRIDASNNISIELPSTTTDLIGFVLCSVLSHHARGHGDLECQLYYDGKEVECLPFLGEMTDFDSHHVFLWCVSDMFIMLKTMDGQNTNYWPNMSFEFSVVKGSKKFVDGVIEACGVCPIYASEYSKFIQQMELEANLGAHKENCQDVDENSFHGILKYANFLSNTRKCGNLVGSNIPEWFTYKSSRKDHFHYLEVRFQLALDYEKLMGFIFCFVIPNFSSEERDQCYSTCNCDGKFDGPSGWHYLMKKWNSDNVFIWYDPFYSECVLKGLRQGKGCDAKLDHSFSFYLGYGLLDEWSGLIIDECLIEECGVRPIYASEYTNFLQEEKLKVSKRPKRRRFMRTKRHQNIDDDQQQFPSTKKVSSIDQSIPMNSEPNTSHDVNELLRSLAQLNLESTKNSIDQSIPMNSEPNTSYDVNELLRSLAQLNLESTKNDTHHK
ncbi:hypothetical protein K1719_009134 [Acacia pycnantha]|nr:hypothetical protein K1719_009134 [Acacia pycnantha]